MEFDRVKFAGLRITKGMSQGALAEMIGVARQTLAHWEKGVTVPTLKDITSAADVLEVKAEELVS